MRKEGHFEYLYWFGNLNFFLYNIVKHEPTSISTSPGIVFWMISHPKLYVVHAESHLSATVLIVGIKIKYKMPRLRSDVNPILKT